MCGVVQRKWQCGVMRWKWVYCGAVGVLGMMQWPQRQRMQWTLVTKLVPKLVTPASFGLRLERADVGLTWGSLARVVD